MHALSFCTANNDFGFRSTLFYIPAASVITFTRSAYFFLFYRYYQIFEFRIRFIASLISAPRASHRHFGYRTNYYQPSSIIFSAPWIFPLPTKVFTKSTRFIIICISVHSSKDFLRIDTAHLYGRNITKTGGYPFG